MNLILAATARPSVLKDAWNTFSDPGHVIAEAGWELITFLAGIPVGRWWVKRHDRKFHEPQGPSA